MSSLELHGLTLFLFLPPGIDYKPPEYKERDNTEAPKFTTPLNDRATTVGYSTKLLCSVRGCPKVRRRPPHLFPLRQEQPAPHVFRPHISGDSPSRVRTVMENLEKSWNFKMVVSRPGKVMEKNVNHKSFGKVMEMCYIHMFIYAEFEIINMFFKRKTQNISRRTLSTRNIFKNVIFIPRFQFGHGKLV